MTIHGMASPPSIIGVGRRPLKRSSPYELVNRGAHLSSYIWRPFQKAVSCS